MNGKPPCVCDSRKNIRCDEAHCDLAGPGAPGDPSQCRICYIRLGGDPSVKAGETPPRGQKYSFRQRQSTPCVHLGMETGETRPCKLCGSRGKVIAMSHCSKFGTCSVQNHIGDGTKCCLSCTDYEPSPPAPRDFFDRVVCINLKRRPDRWEEIQRELTEKGWPFKDVERFDAVDPHVVGTPKGWKAGGGAYGCCRSHVRILEECLQAGLNSVLILEDDLRLVPNFPALVAQFLREVPDDWDQLMLGGQHMLQAGRPEAVKPGIVRCKDCQRTHAYAVRGKAMRDLYLLWASPESRTHIDHQMGPWQRGYKVYAPDPFLCGQARGMSDISGRFQPAKFWKKPTGSEPVIVLDCPKEVVAALRPHGLHTGYNRDKETDIDEGLVKVYAGGRCRGGLLARWVEDLQGECVSTEELVLGIWHPGATVGQIRAAWKGPVHELKAATVEEALAAWEMFRRVKA